MKPDRLWQRLPCLVGRHRRSRSQAVRGVNASGGSTYRSVCRHCGIPMERLHHGRWIVARDEGASGRFAFTPRTLGWLAAAILAIAVAGVVWVVIPAGADTAGEAIGLGRLVPDDERLVFSHSGGEPIGSSDAARIFRPIDTTDRGDTRGLKYAPPAPG